MALFLENASNRLRAAMNPKSLSHNQLMRLLASEPHDNEVWSEFARRYQDYLTIVISRECQRLRYEDGLAQIDDLIQDVYIKLLNNNGEAFRTYKGQFENTIWQFLEIVALRVTYNDWRKSNARKRPPRLGRFREISPNHNGDLLDLFPDKSAEDEIDYGILTQAIEECLKYIGTKLRHPNRDIRIFKLHLYDGLSAENIAELPEIGLSPQSVFRIIADVKSRVGKYLSAGE